MRRVKRFPTCITFHSKEGASSGRASKNFRSWYKRRTPVPVLFGLLFPLGLTWIACGGPRASTSETAPLSAGEMGPYAVETLLDNWIDPARNREIPVKIYYPKQSDTPRPVILFSHGLGSSRLRYEYLGRHWAGHGFVSVHVQHKGSDDDLWKGTLFIRRAFLRAAKDPQTALDRPPDLSFALDYLENLNKEKSPLCGRLDLDRIGMAGHSFGGFATLAVAGQAFRGAEGKTVTFSDPRVKAGLVMSPSAPLKDVYAENTFGAIRIPCLHMTGTEDESPLGLTTKEDRRAAYDGTQLADQYLIMFQGGDHAIFTDQDRPFGEGGKDDLFRRLIQTTSTMFWKAYLDGGATAKQQLAGDLKSLLGSDGTIESKRPRTGGAVERGVE